MTNALSALKQGHGIVPVTRAVADLTSRLHNKLEPIPGDFRRCALSSAAEPSAVERAALVERRQQLDDSLVPCDAATVRRAVGMLRSVMAVAQASEETQQLQRAAYLTTLTKYPAWAVEAACAQYLDGQHGEGVHAPKPGEIAIICRKLIAEAQYERAKINAVLDAEVYVLPTEDERREVERMHRALVEELAQAAKQNHADNLRNNGPVTPTGSASSARAEALKELADRKAKREAEQSSLSSQLKAGREPFETERKGEAA